MSEYDFTNHEENSKMAGNIISRFEKLGYKYACITRTQDDGTSVVFMPHIDQAENDTIGFYYPLDLNRDTVAEKLVEAIKQGSDFGREIPGVNCITKKNIR